VTENEPQSLEFVLPCPARPSLSEVRRLLDRPSTVGDPAAMLPSEDRNMEREVGPRLLLSSNDPAYRIAACYRLAEKGRKGSEIVSALAKLIWRDPHPLVKAHAIHALVRLGSVAAAKTLRYEVERLNIFTQPLGVQLEAVKAEAYIGHRRGKADEDFLMAMFDHWRVQPADADSDLMLWAILFAHFVCSWSLLHCSARYPDYIPAVLELVRSRRDQYTRAAAMGVLGTPVVTAEDAAACNEAISDGLADSDEAVRLTALAALGGESTGNPSSYVPEAIERLVSVMADPRETETARRMAAAAMAFQGGQEADYAARLLAALNAVEERDDLFRDLLKWLAGTLVAGVAKVVRRSGPESRRWREIADRLASIQS
jgi:hypothetical protein